jgi:hypothetical protein
VNGADNGQRPTDAARDCGELATAIATARQTIARGGEADLDTLVERLQALLDGLDLGVGPRADRQFLLPQLIGLAEEIEVLGGTIAAECRRCSEELAKGGVSARATAAYAKTNLN